MARMTKTEIEILSQAAANHHGCASASRSVGRGGLRGQRATRALTGLREKGLIGNLETHKSTEAHRGIIVHHATVTGFITEAGRKALEVSR